MKLLVPLRSPNRFYLMKWHGQHCLDMCKTYSLLKSTWPPKDWWLEYLGILHQHGPKSSQKNVSQHFAPSPNPNVWHPVLHLWLPHFFGIFAFRNPTFLLLLMHLATFRPLGQGNPKRARKNMVGFFRKVVKLLESMRVSFQQLTCQTPNFFRSGMVRRKNSTP